MGGFPRWVVHGDLVRREWMNGFMRLFPEGYWIGHSKDTAVVLIR